VQGAKLNTADEDAGGGIAGRDLHRGREGVEGTVAAHEAELDAVYIRAEPKGVDQVGVEAGGEEAGAGDGDEVGDGMRGDGGVIQSAAGGGEGESGGVLGVESHTLRGGGAEVIGACARPVEGADMSEVGVIVGQKDGRASVNATAGVDATEELTLLVGVAAERFGETGGGGLKDAACRGRADAQKGHRAARAGGAGCAGSATFCRQHHRHVLTPAIIGEAGAVGELTRWTRRRVSGGRRRVSSAAELRRRGRWSR
jgi:hypothetical protein